MAQMTVKCPSCERPFQIDDGWAEATCPHCGAVAELEIGEDRDREDTGNIDFDYVPDSLKTAPTQARAEPPSVRPPQKPRPSPVRPSSGGAGTAMRLDCSACKGKSTMVPTSVNRMSPVVVLIGWILVVPSILGIAWAVLCFLSVVGAAGSTYSTSSSAAAEMGTTIGAGIGIILSIGVGIASLVGGLLGYLLIMEKKVWRCSVCGFVLDRA